MYPRDIIIAIDPGVNGGIAIEYPAGDGTFVYPMPATILDLCEVLDVNTLDNTLGVTVYLEKVHSMPGQGVSSTFTFGENYGILRGITTAFGHKTVHLQPLKWQKYFGLQKRDKDESDTVHKNRIKAFAQERYPGFRVTHKTQDALAILEYAREQEKLVDNSQT